MTEQSQVGAREGGILARIPIRLRRILIVASIAYFAGFIWTFTQGAFARLFIPFQWEYFFAQREIASVLGGQWFLYGSSLAGLFINWLVLIGLIAGGYFAFNWVALKQK